MCNKIGNEIVAEINIKENNTNKEIRIINFLNNIKERIILLGMLVKMKMK